MKLQLYGRHVFRPIGTALLLSTVAALALVVPSSKSAPHRLQQSLIPGALLIREDFDVRSISPSGKRGPVLFEIGDGAGDAVRARPRSSTAASSRPTFLIDSDDTAFLAIELAWPGASVPVAPSVEVTKHPSYGPAWTPNGRGFVYSRVLGSPLDLAAHPIVLVLRRQVRDATSERILTTRRNRIQDDEPTWAPDGRRLAFTRSRELVNGQIYILDLPTGRETRITAGQSADWSPMRNALVYQCDFDICVIDLDTGRVRRLTSGKNDGQPLWSPDGRTIAFERLTKSLNTQVRLIPATGGQSHVLVPDGELLDWPRRRQ